MAKKHQSQKASSKKVGRNISKCAYYKAMGVRLDNKRRKVRKHLILHPDDLVARKSI